MRFAVISGFVFGLVIWSDSTACAQFRRNRFEYRDPGRSVSEVDREVQQAMDSAERLIEQRQFIPAVVQLQLVFDHPEDYFLEKDFRVQGTSRTTVKARAQQMVAELPPEGQAAYELQFGTVARSLLNDAMRKRDFEQVAEVVARYKATAAGFDAMQLLIASAFDHNEPLKAALLCDELMSHSRLAKVPKGSFLLRSAFAWHLAGMTDRSVATLNALRELEQPDAWQIGEKRLTPLKKESDVLAWLTANFGSVPKPDVRIATEWAMPRGGPSGNESATTAYPIGGGVWSTPQIKQLRLNPQDTANEKLKGILDHQVRQIEASLRDHNQPMQPIAASIVVGDIVVRRTINDVTAVSLRNGQFLWRSALSDGILSWLSQGSSANFEAAGSAYLRYKLFRDQLSGTLTSDGKSVYAIEESESLLFGPARPRPRSRGVEQADYEQTTKLVAYELETGRLMWEVGGLRGTPPAELSGSFFLGPPLPFEGRLYCLAEMKDELRLVSLIPEDHAVRTEWSQSLIPLNTFNTISSPRRQTGVIPAISDGIIVCPTASGALVAFDLLQQKLRWGYSYDLLRQNIPFDAAGIAPHSQTDDAESRWLDTSPLLVDGRVILASPDSNELHCLNLADGSLIWKRQRRLGLYVACVNDDAVIVVGRTQIVAYSLADGSEVWSSPIEIPEPAGRGVRMGAKYLLPLSTGEIATIDLTNHRILGQSGLPDSHTPGNLAISDGTLVSCGIHDLIGFRPLALIEQQIARLASNPNDADALAVRGELRLNGGEPEKAIADLRESLRHDPKPRVKRVLASTLMTAYAHDSKQFLKSAPELETLVDDPRQQVEFRRLYVRSLNETGDRVGAVTQLIRLADAPQFLEEMTGNSPDYSITLWQNIRSQLLTTFESADPDQQREISRAIEREYESILGSSDRDGKLARLVKLVIHHPAADPVLLQMLESSQTFNDQSARLRLLEQLTESADKTVAASAVAHLASIAIDASQPQNAIPWIDALGSDFASQACQDGKTGRRLCDEWSARDDVRRSRIKAASWPDRPIEAKQGTERNESMAIPVGVVTHVGPHFRDWTFEIDTTDGILTARDLSLHVAWRLQRASFVDVSRLPAIQLHIRGRRLALSCGANLVVMQSTDVDSAPKILFEQTLLSNSLLDRRPPEPNPKRPLLPNGRRFQSEFEPRGYVGFLIGLSNEAIFYQMDNRLFAADAETGQVIWTRSGSTFSRADGTVDTVLALHTVGNDALLLRPLDGMVLQQHKGSREEMPIWYHGTRRLRSEGNDPRIFEMRDFDGDKVVWQIQHPAGTLPYVLESGEFAVLEPSGKLFVFDLTTGEQVVVAETAVVRRHGTGGVLIVQRFGDQYIVVAGAPSDKADARPVTTFRFGVSSDTTFAIDGSVTSVNRSDGRIGWTVPFEQLAYDFGQPGNLPVIVLASRQSEMDRLGRFVQSQRLSALVLDKRTGRVVHEISNELLPPNQESFSPISRGTHFIQDIDEPKLTIAFPSITLELTFPDARK